MTALKRELRRQVGQVLSREMRSRCAGEDLGSATSQDELEGCLYREVLVNNSRGRIASTVHTDTTPFNVQLGGRDHPQQD